MKFRELNKLNTGIPLLLIIFILPVISCRAQSNSKQDTLGPKIKFQHDTFDYGIIPRNSNSYRYIIFSNTGNEPLMISVFGDIVTPVKYPKEPIQPGESAEIKISYPTDRVGPFMNFIAITSNAFPRQKIIYVKGWILHAEDPNSRKGNK